MVKRGHIRYFADENALGVAKILVADHGRADIVVPGDPLIPEVPRGTPDLEWTPTGVRKVCIRALDSPVGPYGVIGEELGSAFKLSARSSCARDASVSDLRPSKARALR